MKAILMSIKPKWCEMIFRGEKTVEVRKTSPNVKLPIKVYVYESIGQGEGAGAVVGEFVCDGIEHISQGSEFVSGNDCLTTEEREAYRKGFWLSGWCIDKPKRYDTPKELSEFVSCKYYHDKECLLSSKTHCKYRVPDLNPDGSVNIFECTKRVTRPPQSWMYVEEAEE